MFGYVEGYSDTGDIKYCPICGEEIGVFHSDGTATCTECGARFGVVVVLENDE